MKSIETEHSISLNETIIWQGRPKHGLLFRRKDLPLTMVYMLFFVFAASIVAFIFTSTGFPLIFYYCGAVLLLVAGYSLFGRFVDDAMLRKRTRYVVTDQHILISFGPYSGKRKTFTLHIGIPQLPPQLIELTELPEIKLVNIDKDGSGTIDFSLPPIYRSLWGGRTGGQAIVIYPRFQDISNAEEVYRKIVEARRKRCSAVGTEALFHEVEPRRI
ncbi:hypothetical protein [Geomonas sp. Red276]